ncbi:trophoblast glycoprotein [Chanos chanos]|uniref:Trophoblast glycoprotein n=1 Tax=Chanos chanos TaxID=29144 RepID=A0A6J2W6Y7_CHACN|nr:trophoblast glycoprotein-like [Chanos chanos]
MHEVGSLSWLNVAKYQVDVGQFSLGVIFLLFFSIVPSSACPDKCVCNATTVQCLNQNLVEIPRPLPTNTETLIVTGNNISRLTNDSFPVRLEYLTKLNLSGNGIEQVDPEAFTNLPNLVLCELSNNNIREFSPDAFSKDNKIEKLIMSRSVYSSSYVDVISKLLRRTTRVTHLVLSNNDLPILPPDMFSNLSSLSVLDLRNNSIVDLKNVYLGNRELTKLDLQDNSLKVLYNSTLQNFSLSKLEVTLSGNPWFCDCNMADMLVWLNTHDQVVDKMDLSCTSPENLNQSKLLQLASSQLQCKFSGNMKNVLETSYVFLGMVLALIGVIFLLVLYLNRKGIKRWMHNIRDACRDHMEGYHYRYEINTDPRLANLSLNSDV